MKPMGWVERTAARRKRQAGQPRSALWHRVASTLRAAGVPPETAWRRGSRALRRCALTVTLLARRR